MCIRDSILAAKRGEELIPIPGGDYCFREGETMLVLGADRDVQKLSLIHISSVVSKA